MVRVLRSHVMSSLHISPHIETAHHQEAGARRQDIKISQELSRDQIIFPLLSSLVIAGETLLSSVPARREEGAER